MSNNGNPQSMDLGKLEIYIPVEAEVKSIPLWSLSNSVLRGMGLPQSDSRRLSDSPQGIWICPAVIRRKGQKLAMENMSSLLGKESRAPGPFQMSFVSANRTAYKVLKGMSHASLLPQGSAPPAYKDAVIIYHGLIYLCSKKPSQSRRQRETREPQPASESSIPPTSSSESQKKRHTSLEPADGRLERKKMCITLPQTSPKQIKDPVPETETQATTDQELLSDNRPTAGKVTHSENKKGSDVSSSTTSLPVPKPTDRVHTAGLRGHEVAEEAAAWFQPLHEADQEGAGYLGVEEADCTDNVVGVVEQSSTRSWTGRPSHGAPTSLQAEFDFKELAEEEKIARMKAKLRQSEAALSNLHSS